jgi:outer membrane biosynthesis protein TonB
MAAEDISPSIETPKDSEEILERTSDERVEANLHASARPAPAVEIATEERDGVYDANEVCVVPPAAEKIKPTPEAEPKASATKPLAEKAIGLADTRTSEVPKEAQKPAPVTPKPPQAPMPVQAERPSTQPKPENPPHLQRPAVTAPEPAEEPARAKETPSAKATLPAPAEVSTPKADTNNGATDTSHAETVNTNRRSEKAVPLKYAEHVRSPQRVDLEQRAERLRREAEENIRRNEEIAKELQTIQEQLGSCATDNALTERRLYSGVRDRADMTDAELAEISRLDSELPERSRSIFEPISAHFRGELLNKVPPIKRGRHPSELPWYSEDPARFEKFIRKNEEEPVEWTEPRTEEIGGKIIQVEYDFMLRYVRLGKEGTPELVGYSVTAPHGAINELQRIHQEESVEVICDNFGVQEVRHHIPRGRSTSRGLLNYEIYRVGEVNEYHRTNQVSRFAYRNTKRLVQFGMGMAVSGSESYYYDPDEYNLKMPGNQMSEGRVLEVDRFLNSLQTVADWVPIMNTRH